MAQALEILAQIRQVLESIPSKLTVSELYQGRQEGSLTAVSTLSNFDDEVGIEELKRGALTYSTGSIISLPSGQQGKILGWRLDDPNRLVYETELANGKVIGLRNTGSNITLVQGEEALLYLDCGTEGIDQCETVCPVCGAGLQ